MSALAPRSDDQRFNQGAFFFISFHTRYMYEITATSHVRLIYFFFCAIFFFCFFSFFGNLWTLFSTNILLLQLRT